jgi:NADH-quinone oxidoreductase subunit M
LAQALATLLLLPLAGSLLLAMLPQALERVARPLALLTTAVTLAFSGWLWTDFTRGMEGMQFELTADWIPGLGSSIHIGVDGLSLPLVVLTTLLTFVAVLASGSIKNGTKTYLSLVLLLEAGLVGVFVALDLILFYLFWEIVLIPMFFLIHIWGGKRRAYAAVKFFVYTLAGSLAMLAGIIVLYLQTGARTFDLVALQPLAAELGSGTQTWIFVAFALALAVKVPIVPFHTWLPDAHVEAPTAVSVLLAGVLLKMGAYGFLRLGPDLLPLGFLRIAPGIALLGVVSIVWGAAVALRQTDLKRLVAYSSVSHMGYVMLGIAAGTSAGITGASIQMFSHGLIAGMSFLLVGALYERAHTREMEAFGGIAAVTPVLAGTLVFASFASAGLPGMSGFVGEFLVVVGSFEPYTGYAVVAAATVLVTCGYLLWMLRSVVFGPLNRERADMKDLTRVELASILTLAAVTVIVGVFPATLGDVMGASLEAIVRTLG